MTDPVPTPKHYSQWAGISENIIVTPEEPPTPGSLPQTWRDKARSWRLTGRPSSNGHVADTTQDWCSSDLESALAPVVAMIDANYWFVGTMHINWKVTKPRIVEAFLAG